MRRHAIAAAFLLGTVLAAPLVGQGHEIVVSIYGGGADHLVDLQESPPVWFMPGYALGASVGLQLNETFAIHGDFTYTRNPTEGTGDLAAGDVNRFYYGIHGEYRHQMGKWSPYAFAGLGAVSIDQLGIDSFSPTTRPALMFGGGLFYKVPSTRLELVGELKGLTYKWNMAGFDRGQLDVTYTAGLSYRFMLGL